MKGLREEDIDILIISRKDKYLSIHQLRETGIIGELSLKSWRMRMLSDQLVLTDERHYGKCRQRIINLMHFFLI